MSIHTLKSWIRANDNGLYKRLLLKSMNDCRIILNEVTGLNFRENDDMDASSVVYLKALKNKRQVNLKTDRVRLRCVVSSHPFFTEGRRYATHHDSNLENVTVMDDDGDEWCLMFEDGHWFAPGFDGVRFAAVDVSR